jgi:hypothetical protein
MSMRSWQIALASGVAVGLSGAGAWAQSGQAVRTVVRPDGVWRMPASRPAVGPAGTGGVTDALLWIYNEPIAIAQSVALAPTTGKAWVGQTLNDEALQRFLITGPGTPEIEFPAGPESPSLVSSAQGADLTVFVDRNGAEDPYIVRAYAAAGTTQLWEQGDFGTGLTNPSNIKVSRDGSTVAVAFYDPAVQNGTLYILDGATGAILQTWTSPGTQTQVGSVDLTDTGDLVLANVWGPGPNAIVLDTSDMSQLFAVNGSGSGGQMQISGNGDVFVVGGFSFEVYKRTAGVYTRVINFTAPTSWFGFGSDVSRDGSTVGVFSHNYLDGNSTAVRMWDMGSATLLGTQTFTGSGSFQNSIEGAAMSDDGSVFAVASWGNQDNANPEVMIFDRSVQQIGSVDTVGSPMAIDITGNGRYVLVGSKAMHANTFGNGGNTYLFDTGVGGAACYGNCDESTTEPVLNVLDFNCFLNRFSAGESYANCDGSTTEPVLNVLDFNCFLNSFSAGCP